MNKLFFLLISIQLMFSCKKKDCNKVLEKGSVYDQTTNKPISDADVVLIANKSGCFSCSGGYVAKIVKTDKNGEFLIDFEGSSDYYYTMKAFKDKYFNSVEGGARNECSPDKRKKTLLYINPEAYLKFNIIGENGIIGINGDFEGFSITGGPTDTIIIKRVEGDKKINIYWEIIKNGNTSQFNDIIYSQPFDTTYFQITY
jgi:hypothetical protein